MSINPKNAFEKRFELQLTNIQQSLHKKSGVKKADKVHQRIGRAKERYPSVAKYYTINAEEDKGNITATNWQKDIRKESQAETSIGEYFLRSNTPIDNIPKIWETYNSIIEIESSFRCLKTDLDLSPIYHKNDDATMAHLNLGLLGYWLVNTVRYQLKSQAIKSNWTEKVRIANIKKIITTYGQNVLDESIAIRRCFQPSENLESLNQKLGHKSQPFVKRKSVVHKPELKKTETHDYS